MKKLSLILLILFASNAMASSLPNCPSDQSKRYHNCFGTINLNNGDKYVGEFKDDKKHGQGTYTFSDGENYIGEYKDDIKHGQGTYTFGKNSEWAGDKYVGEFKDDIKHGQGTYTYADGAIERGYFMNDEYVPDICEGMSLTKGTDPFGQCVVELIKQIREDD